MTTFGASAPLSAVVKHFGFDAASVAARAKAVVDRVRSAAR
jgi:transketolase